ncbi:TetR/AcrR family transcriptional regulator [Kutzneria buriramensis]|uniref:DNA-binding transcriptional regulator YbjK n=1 Tax=Kutzneria buriramensis TaxID=1045776 RepID=A0A3E0HD75_9PSEU|nr:TetR family transcriptional regulator C-terminal domain-containing protein [Kutzneria buriramensis]REH42612.1 DNA-binding transcriptional regulator YbjK [Kutzneria buriramensis]
MPKVVDHQARRRELAEAVWRVISTDGVHHASVRAVAAESGWSTGSLRHYFPTQDSLLAFAMELLADKARARLQAIDDQDTRTVLRRVAEALLPVTSEHRVEVEVWLALLARAQVDPGLQRAERDNRDALLAVLSGMLWRATAQGELSRDRNPDLEAVRLLAVIDGMTLACVFSPERIGSDDAVRVIDRHLDDLLGPASTLPA